MIGIERKNTLMPQRTVWIRDEDMDLWMAVDRATVVRSALEDIRKQQDKGFGLTNSMTKVDIKKQTHLVPTLYAIIIEATGHIVSKDLTYEKAEMVLAERNIGGDMIILEQK
jgi:hypothetical protein